MKLFLSISIILLCLYQPVNSQDNQTDQVVQQIIDAYNSFDYQLSEQKGLAALEHYQDFTPEQLLLIHQYLAFINFSRKNLDAAKNHFQAALSINPKLALSPQIASPKIIAFFNLIKQDFAKSHKQQAFSRYLLIRDNRVDAGLRSAILPGWGQMHKGERKKGITMISLWAGSVGSILLFQFKKNKAHQDYLTAKLPTDIEDKYETYNRYYKIRNSFILAAFGIWLYSYLDALLTTPKIATTQVTHLQINTKFTNISRYPEISFSFVW